MGWVRLGRDWNANGTLIVWKGNEPQIAEDEAA